MRNINQKSYKRSEISCKFRPEKSAEGDRSHRYPYISMSRFIALVARKGTPHLPTPHQFVNQKFQSDENQISFFR